MKVSPTADYTIRVLRQESEESGPAAPLYAGIYVVALNHLVTVAFVPDVSAAAPPWDPGRLPADLDEVTTVGQARLATALLSAYVVTPNDARAGTEETFHWPDAGGGPGVRGSGVVFYVAPAEFADYTEDLAILTGVAGRLYSERRVSQLRDHPAIAFLERRVVRSPRLDPRDAALLGQPR
jgi:hypothetical protein